MVPITDQFSSEENLRDVPNVIYSDVDIPANDQIQVPVYLNVGGIPIQFNTLDESPIDPSIFQPPSFC